MPSTSIPVINVQNGASFTRFVNGVENSQDVPLMYDSKIGDYYKFNVSFGVRLSSTKSEFNKLLPVMYKEFKDISHYSEDDGTATISLPFNFIPIYYDYARECFMVHKSIIETGNGASFDELQFTVNYANTYVNPSSTITSGALSGTTTLRMQSISV